MSGPWRAKHLRTSMFSSSFDLRIARNPYFCCPPLLLLFQKPGTGLELISLFLPNYTLEHWKYAQYFLMESRCCLRIHQNKTLAGALHHLTFAIFFTSRLIFWKTILSSPTGRLMGSAISQTSILSAIWGHLSAIDSLCSSFMATITS